MDQGGKIEPNKVLYPSHMTWGTVEGNLVASSKASLEPCLCPQASQLPKIHDTNSRAEMVSLLHSMRGEDLAKWN